jgi:hypothetical protein
MPSNCPFALRASVWVFSWIQGKLNSGKTRLTCLAIFKLKNSKFPHWQHFKQKILQNCLHKDARVFCVFVLSIGQIVNFSHYSPNDGTKVPLFLPLEIFQLKNLLIFPERF